MTALLQVTEGHSNCTAVELSYDTSKPSQTVKSRRYENELVSVPLQLIELPIRWPGRPRSCQECELDYETQKVQTE